MTEKRFKIVDEQFISYYGGTGHKISNGECGFWLWHSKTESQKVCDRLNNMLDENDQLKTTISRLIEQNRKNNDLLVSDIRLLEKALWCQNCTINIKRLRELKKEFEK